MKKVLALVLAASMLLLAACTGGSKSTAEGVGTTKAEESSAGATNEDKSEASKAAETEQGKLKVESGIGEVKMTFPASFFGGTDPDEIAAQAKTEGVEATVNADGSVTYSMTKAQQDKMLGEMRESLNSSIKEVIGSEDSSIKDITYNDNFSEITVVCDKAAYSESMDSILLFGLGLSATFYQSFAGVDPNAAKVLIKLQDAATKEVFDTITYPEALQQ